MLPRALRKQAAIHWGKAHRVNEPLRGEITMSINMSNDKNISTDTEAYYEAVASQEEIYLEETEEELRAILTSDDPSPSRNSG